MKHVLMTTACLVLCATPSVAADQNGLYARITAGWNISQDQDFSTLGGNIDTALDSGYALSAALGHDYGHIRGEIELSYRENEVDSHKLSGATVANSTGETSALALMANGYYDFDTQTKITPYVGAGLGFARVDVKDYAGGGNNDVADGDETVFAYQVIAGLEYPVTARTSVTGEYRYFATTDVDIDTNLGGAQGSDVNYDNHSILLGVKHNFDTGL